MTDIDLNFIGRQLQAVQDEQKRQAEHMRQLDIRMAGIENALASVNDRLRHLDDLMTAILAELRAIRTQTMHMGERITALETAH